MVTVEKYHGTGNDFVIVDATENVPDRRSFARELCDRKSGISHPSTPRIGADGVLFLAMEADYSPPRVVMTLVQPDGSVAAMCGNGARCAAAWAADRVVGREQQSAETTEIMVDTQAGTRRAKVTRDHVTIEMGTPTFAPGAIPMNRPEEMIEAELGGLTVTAVNTGVPHVVSFVDDVAAVDLEDIGPEIRYDEDFPDGTNVTLAARREDSGPASDSEGDLDGRASSVGGFDQRTYERGVEAETDSCGTGAVAIGVVAERLGLVETGEPVAVHPPGGRLLVTRSATGATLQGPVEREYAGEVDAVEPSRVDVTSD